MIERYKIDVDETSNYIPRIKEISDEDGEWVKYEDVESILKFIKEYIDGQMHI